MLKELADLELLSLAKKLPTNRPLVVSLRLGYLKAVSTSCWQIVSTSEVFICLQFT